ncbi:hypothetical protein IE4803_PC00597 (plasmid) [Rhizobium etli bv. phaseoli str. IE4803]|nr:hypothetical protein IE4803_PC00597 [Rhizobium etli bv. phaseoli str. IE4803]
MKPGSASLSASHPSRIALPDNLQQRSRPLFAQVPGGFARPTDKHVSKLRRGRILVP